MGVIDERCLSFFDDEWRFADLMNFALFDGQQIIKADELLELDSTFTAVTKKKRKRTSGKHTTVDKIRLWRGKYLRILIQEYQTYIDYRMVFRCMKSEALAYDKQYIVRRREHLKAKDLSLGNEFLSGIKESDRFMPVITVVVNLSDEPWTGARSLYEMLDFEDELLQNYVSDHRINVFDYHDHDNYDKLVTEARHIFEVLKYKSDKDKLIELSNKDDRYKHLSDETADFIEELAQMKIERNENSGGRNMCKALLDLKAEGKAEGIAEGIIDLLEDYGDVGDNLRGLIMSQSDINTLKKWHKKAARCTSIAEFVASMDE